MKRTISRNVRRIRLKLHSSSKAIINGVCLVHRCRIVLGSCTVSSGEFGVLKPCIHVLTDAVGLSAAIRFRTISVNSARANLCIGGFRIRKVATVSCACCALECVLMS